ncbi:MAG: hypothetical protein ACFFD2_10785 [Promethearchaeota archaeon]
MSLAIAIEALAVILLIIILGIWGLVLVFISFVEDYTTFSIIVCPFIVTLFFLNFISQALGIIIPNIAEILQILALIIGTVIMWQFFNLIWR